MFGFWVLMFFTVIAALVIIVRPISNDKKELRCLYNAEKEKNFTYERHEQKIKMMKQTMLICYNISEWEADYYSRIFYNFSKQYDLPWEVYPAIIQIESKYHTDLLSEKRAKGVMQILETTGKTIADKIGIKYVNDRSLWNELLNVPIGCTYLSDMMKEQGVENGIKCYLGGPNYKKSESNAVIKKYIANYYNDVWVEYQKTKYIYRGVVADYLHKTDIDTLYLDNN
jgi:soluble lytic murein transglycosylase